MLNIAKPVIYKKSLVFKPNSAGFVMAQTIKKA